MVFLGVEMVNLFDVLVCRMFDYIEDICMVGEFCFYLYLMLFLLMF